MAGCVSCGAGPQPEGARFCFACGTPLGAPVCTACGADLIPGARFCSSCGAAQAADAPASRTGTAQPIAARRVTSVLFGDLVGFTTLSESRDQEQVRELLSGYFDQCRAIVERYGGTIEKFIGDAVMAVWGVPTAHEDDAERAVRAGLELVAAVAALGSDVGVPDLAMRVGIVTGEVAVTIGAQHEGMVAGDAVNTAARVQGAAAPGQVWVDETTRLLTSSAITYVDVGSHDLKGKAEPVPLWAVRAVVAAVGGAQRADGLEAPLVGRDREMRLVKELFHQVEETQRPALLVVDGEAGVGKSRMAWEFQKYMDGLSASVFWHSGRCLSYGEGVAFYAFAEAVRGRLQLLTAQDADTVDTEPDAADLPGALSTGLAAVVADPDERAWLEPRLAALLGIGAVGSFQREDLFSAWTTFLQRLGESGTSGVEPVVLLIDDAQYADDGLLAFLEHLVAVGSFPCFVALLTRPGLLEANPSLATNRRSAVVHLDALPDRDMRQLLDGLVAGLDDAARDALVRRAEGIPLYAVETVRSLIDRDLVVPRGGQYVRADDRPLELDQVGAPATLHALVAARLDTLTPAQRRVLDQASVAGQSFTRATLAALCAEADDLDEQLGALSRLQLLRQERDRLSPEVGQFQFVQEVVRQVAYGTLARRDRKSSHLALAEQLTGAAEEASLDVAAIVAQHYLEAIDAVPEDADVAALTDRAVAELRRAASRARALGAPAEAAGHLRTALQRAGGPRLRAEIELELAVALRDRGAAPASIEHAVLARDAFDALGEDVQAARACAVLAQSASHVGADYEDAYALARERYDALRDRVDATAVLVELARAMSALNLRMGRGFGELAEEYARLAELLGDEAEIADSYVNLGLHYMVHGIRGLGRILLESGADLARRIHHLTTLNRALINLVVMWTDEDAARAVANGREALAVSRQTGSTTLVAWSAANLAFAEVIAGEWDEALATVAYPEVDEPLVQLVQARIAGARRLGWEPEVDLAAREPAEDLRPHWLVARALTAHAHGDAAAVELAREAGEAVYALTALADDFTLIWQLATEVLWERGARAELDLLLALVDEHRSSSPSTGTRAQRARLAGLIAAADGDDTTAEERLRTAAALADLWHSAPTAARCRADLGLLLARTGRPVEAAELLDRARAAYAELGAVRWTEELDAALVPVPLTR